MDGREVREVKLWQMLDLEARVRIVMGLSGVALMVTAFAVIGGWWALVFFIGWFLEQAAKHRKD